MMKAFHEMWYFTLTNMNIIVSISDVYFSIPCACVAPNLSSGRFAFAIQEGWRATKLLMRLGQVMATHRDSEVEMRNIETVWIPCRKYFRCFMQCGIFAANHWLLKTIAQWTEREQYILTYTPGTIQERQRSPRMEDRLGCFYWYLTSFKHGFSEKIAHFRLTKQQFRDCL